jgi:hypothetical protein
MADGVPQGMKDIPAFSQDVIQDLTKMAEVRLGRMKQT